MLKKTIVFILIAVFAVSIMYGCAGYSAKTVNIQDADKYAFSQNKDGVIFAIDPYFDEKKQKEVFDTNHSSMVKEGLMPVNVIVTNNSGSMMSIDKNDIVLILPDGSTNKPLTVEEAYKRAKKSTAGRTILWGVLTGGIGAAIAGASSSGANDAIMTDLQNKELKPQTINANSTVNGFVYFEVPKDIKSLEGIKVVSNLKNGQKSLEFSIPLR